MSDNVLGARVARAFYRLLEAKHRQDACDGVLEGSLTANCAQR